MNWLIEWQALSARIKGILDAGSFFYKALHHSSEDSRSVKEKILLKDAEKIFSNLNEFSTKYQSFFPKDAADCLSGFLDKPELREQNFFKTPQDASGNVQFALTALGAFQSEFNYLIADTQFIARRITERAFIHLQRCIVVDEEVRQKWQNAFNKRETHCEKLGAVHLLYHGVWAFKAYATTGGRTDIIFNEPLPSATDIESAADALVLTEWKLVKAQNQLQNKIQEAQKQAEIYSSDVLGGIEIRNYCYLVMVSEKRLEMPVDNIKNGITFRHINIAVNPENPSTESRK